MENAEARVSYFTKAKAWFFIGVFLCFARPIAGGPNQVIVWGDNTYGQTNIPVYATNVVALAAGDYHCLALRIDGSVIAWGNNGVGETNVPINLTNGVGIVAGSTHSLAVRADGSLTLWGRMGTVPIPLSPAATNVVALAPGTGASHGLALRADGSLLDWGIVSLTNIPPAASNAVSVAAGASHSLALRADGRVVAWGDNSYGQTDVPASATNVIAIAAGWQQNAALRANGTVVAWGSVFGGSISPPTTATNVVDIACGGNHILALRGDGSVVGWGMTAFGVTTIPKTATNIVAVAGGGYDSLALVGSGAPLVLPGPSSLTVDSGLTAYLRLRVAGALPLSYQWSCNGTNLPGATNSVLTLTNVQPSQAGSYYTLTVSNQFGIVTNAPIALKELPLEALIQPATRSAVVGATLTFTANVSGQGPFRYQWQHEGNDLPDATNQVLTLTNVQVANSGVYAVGVTNGFGGVSASAALQVTPTIITNPLRSQSTFPGGTANFGLGLQAIIPVQFQWQFNGMDIDGATSNSLTLSDVRYEQGGVYTLIFADDFETVTNSAQLSVVPVAAWGSMNQSKVAPGLTNLIAISCGQSHALALDASGLVYGWGNNFHGEASRPPGLINVIAIAAGNGISLALRANGTVVEWGSNFYGTTNVPNDLSNVVAIAAGDFHELALKSDGTVVAWGYNGSGQTNVPPGLSNVVAIAAGEWNSMALKSDGTVVAWGAGTNNTGSPNFGQSQVPANLSNVIQIATGGPDDLALKGDGSVTGWGGNFYGENSLPIEVSNVVSIVAGYAHTLALRADSTVAAWGLNSLGQATVPVGLSNVVALSASGFSSLALVSSTRRQLKMRLSEYQLSAQGFTVSISSYSGRTYALEYKTSLDDPNWTALRLVAGTGGKLTLTDTGITNASQRFYRVRQW